MSMEHEARENSPFLLAGLALGALALGGAFLYNRTPAKTPITKVAPVPADVAAAVATVEAAAVQAEDAAAAAEAPIVAEDVPSAPVDQTVVATSTASDAIVTPEGEVFTPVETEVVAEPLVESATEIANKKAKYKKLVSAFITSEARAEVQRAIDAFLAEGGSRDNIPEFYSAMLNAKVQVRNIGLRKNKKKIVYLVRGGQDSVTANKGDFIITAEYSFKFPNKPANPPETMFFLADKTKVICPLGNELIVKSDFAPVEVPAKKKKKKAKSNPEMVFDLMPLLVPAGVFYLTDRYYGHKSFWIPAGAAVASYFFVTMSKTVEEPSTAVVEVITNPGELAQMGSHDLLAELRSLEAEISQLQRHVSKKGVGEKLARKVQRLAKIRSLLAARYRR